MPFLQLPVLDIQDAACRTDWQPLAPSPPSHQPTAWSSPEPEAGRCVFVPPLDTPKEEALPLPPLASPLTQRLGQTPTITRYLARMHLYPGHVEIQGLSSAEIELYFAQQDAIFQRTLELSETLCPRPGGVMIASLHRMMSWFTPEEREENLDIYLSRPEFFPAVAETLNRSFSWRDGPFFGGAAPSHADFGVFYVLDMLETMRPGAADKFCPDLREWRQHFAALPAIRAYLDERPLPEEGGIHRMLWEMSQTSLEGDAVSKEFLDALLKKHGGRTASASAAASGPVAGAGAGHQ